MKTWWVHRVAAVEDPLHPRTRERVVRLQGSGIQAAIPWVLAPDRWAGVPSFKVRANTLAIARLGISRLTDDEAMELVRQGHVLVVRTGGGGEA